MVNKANLNNATHNKIFVGVAILLLGATLIGLFKQNDTVHRIEWEAQSLRIAVNKLEQNIKEFVGSGERFTAKDGKVLKEYIDLHMKITKVKIQEIINEQKQCQKKLYQKSNE